jgi:thymidylate synthase
MRYDLSQSFPLLTTKTTFWRGIAEELLWFVQGDTNAKHLQEKKIKIWDGNASRDFLDKNGKINQLNFRFP